MLRFLFSLGFVLLTSVALLAAACSNTGGSLPDPDAPSESDEAPAPEDIVSGIGTVQYVELEGGFYGIVADDSTRYNPQNLSEEYREDGLRVRFRAAERDVMTTQMWGTPVEILDIMPIDGQ